MSIQGTPGITGAARSFPPAPEPPAAASARVEPVAAPEIDALTQQPVPLRFPWLSRLAQQLESASPQRSAFPPAPALGDHLDQSA